jgi:periplasmic divalent cation tolerance protein
MDEIVVFVSCASEEEAEKIAHGLLESRLAVCINILPSVTSLFSWQGEIHRDRETLMIIKSLQSVFPVLDETIKKHHSYELPEIIALPIIQGSKDYLDWLRESTRPKQQL